MSKAKRYQVKVAKSTITEDGLPNYIDPDKWYNVMGMFFNSDKGLSPNQVELFYVESATGNKNHIVTCMKNACHLNGANWRLRVVKDAS